ncbi:ATP-binding protein [Albimonas sp. CAU 1670]|uniref:ATP-binding protein n=1 Tax=Albimonas sp. CAU 1670 TaxID=3032599 RepID=UPI0023DC3A09|nr:ATP-binding protein [Albimonas sp. CAU 1670]MDF2234641.1 ATP-binding protein [Albimonas sp. CAU 1670]
MPLRGETARRIAVALAALGAAGAAGGLGAPLWAQGAAGLFGAALFAFALRIPQERGAAAPPPPRPGGLEPGLGRAALERLPFPLLLIDPAGLIEYANPAARALFERLRVGEHHSMSFRAPDFLDALAEAQAGAPPRSFDFTLHGDRNRVIRAHVDGAEQPGRPDRPGRRHVLCLFHERTQDLRLERMRTDFIANASHELRTPLASIRGFIETLQGPARDDAEARERFLGIMQAQAGRMQRLVDDLLSLNRIELNEHVAPTERQDLGEIAHETAEALAPVADERGVEIRVLAPASGPMVRGDRDQLIQAIGNLLENGMKYGEGPVEILPAPASASHPGMVGLTVRDHGEGIPREHLPRLTERFYRVSVRRSRNQGGTGLGLAIVKHIMSRHRGELTVESEPGEGASFTLWLPADGGEAAGRAARAAPRAAQASAD